MIRLYLFPHPLILFNPFSSAGLSIHPHRTGNPSGPSISPTTDTLGGGTMQTCRDRDLAKARQSEHSKSTRNNTQIRIDVYMIVPHLAGARVLRPSVFGIHDLVGATMWLRGPFDLLTDAGLVSVERVVSGWSRAGGKWTMKWSIRCVLLAFN